jgi:hypothetical protein
VMAVSHLYLTSSGNRKSLSGCFMCLYFSHFSFLLFYFLNTNVIDTSLIYQKRLCLF